MCSKMRLKDVLEEPCAVKSLRKLGAGWDDWKTDWGENWKVRSLAKLQKIHRGDKCDKCSDVHQVLSKQP